MAITQVITDLPDAPQRTQPPAEFITKADAHVASLTGFVDETNIAIGEINTTQDEINTSESNSATSEGNAASSAAASANSALIAAASANFKGTWVSLTGALNKPSSVLHDGTYWQLLNDLADVTASEPSVTGDWASIPQALKVAPRTSAASLTVELPNELQDGSAFPLPLANSVPVNTSIEIEQPLFFIAFKPSVTRSGSDNINGDTVIEFASPTSIKLTSNGVDTWRL